MRVEVSEFERADGVESKVFFAQRMAGMPAEIVPDLVRRLMQTAILRGDPAHMVRILTDTGAEVFRWNISQESASLAAERRA